MSGASSISHTAASTLNPGRGGTRSVCATTMEYIGKFAVKDQGSLRFW